jgi:ADP-ribose pyrophosphatase
MAYRTIEKQHIYSGKKIQVEVHHLEDDNEHRIQKEVVVHPGAVVILPFLDDKTILLIRNRRYAISQLLVELPAGTLEKGEAPMNCAGRELLEETGYLAGASSPSLISFPPPASSARKCTPSRPTI